MKTNLKIVKLIGTKSYEVEMLEGNAGYYIRYERRGDESEYSELIGDFNLASFLFDLKVSELAGH